MKRSLKLFVSCALIAIGASACVPQPVLVRQELIAGKSVKHLLVLTNATDGDGNLYDYVMRVCDYNEQGLETGCKDSTILKSVKAQSVY